LKAPFLVDRFNLGICDSASQPHSFDRVIAGKIPCPSICAA
jgi:hypothetical protein